MDVVASTKRASDCLWVKRPRLAPRATAAGRRLLINVRLFIRRPRPQRFRQFSSRSNFAAPPPNRTQARQECPNGVGAPPRLVGNFAPSRAMGALTEDQVPRRDHWRVRRVVRYGKSSWTIHEMAQRAPRSRGSVVQQLVMLLYRWNRRDVGTFPGLGKESRRAQVPILTTQSHRAQLGRKPISK